MNDANPPMSDECKCPQCGTPLHPGELGGLCPACLLRQAVAGDSVTGGGKAAPFEPPSPEDLAPLFPQLEIISLIGKGGMGAVYKARQRELDRVVALKILPSGIGGDPAFAGRFAREAKALAKLNHPGIVTLYEFGQTAVPAENGLQLFFFLMEFVDGVNLRQLLAGGRVAPREALAIVPDICDALQFAHDHGIVHRDIKPENILIDRRGRVKVADFGLAKLIGPDAEPVAETGIRADVSGWTEAGKIMGTPSYMAPEQSQHPGEVDHRADIYSLGVVFYQMLTGDLPAARIEPPSKKVRIDVRIDEVVLRALEKNPELRYQQAGVFKTRVETVGAEMEKTPKQEYRKGGEAVRYAGFWRRLLAFGIDFTLVNIAVFPLIVMLALVVPNSVVVRVPFGLFTSERILEKNPSERKNVDGSTTVDEERLIEVTALGKWRYLYREEVKRNAGQNEQTRHLVDPFTREEVKSSTSENLALLALLIYCTIMEAGAYQATFGKMAVGIRVTDVRGQRLTFGRSAARNASKLLSAVTLMVGFLMAGWTRKKQALHDKIADCVVSLGNAPPDPLEAHEVKVGTREEAKRRFFPVESARAALTIPASGLRTVGVILIGVVGFMMAAGAMMLFDSEAAKAFGITMDRAFHPFMTFYLLAGILLIQAASSMRRLRGFGVAVAGCILSLFTVIGLPFGIWGLFVLSRREVQEAFDASSLPPKPQWRRRKLMRVGGLLLGFACLAVIAAAMALQMGPRVYRSQGTVEFKSPADWPDRSLQLFTALEVAKRVISRSEPTDVRQVRNTDLAIIGARSADPRQAASVANALMERMKNDFQDKPGVIFRILEKAEPSTEPHRPNKVAIMGITTFFAVLFLALPGLILLLVGLCRRDEPKQPKGDSVRCPSGAGLQTLGAPMWRRLPGRIATIGVPLAVVILAVFAFRHYADPQSLAKNFRQQTEQRLNEARRRSTDAVPPVMESLLGTMQRDGEVVAVSRFLEVDWSARRLFSPGSILGLSEDQFAALPESERAAKSGEMNASIEALRKLTASVELAGLDAAAKKDFAQAHKCFNSLKACGRALDNPGSLLIVRLLGQAVEKQAVAGQAKLPDENPIQEPTVTLLAEYDWAKLAADGRLAGGVLVRMDGREVLKIENTGDTPLQLSLLKIHDPPISAMQYALEGEIKYESVRGTGYLEMWSLFPFGKFFTRTLGVPGSGLMAQISGTSGWRGFSLPFVRSGTESPPTLLELNLFLPGKGTVFIRPLRLTQPAGANPDSSDEAAAVSAAEHWLAGIDAGDYPQSWKDAAEFFQAAIPEAGWSTALTSVRKPLGALVSRKLKSAQYTKSLPGAPDGEYVVMQFEASFAAKKTAVETVTFLKEKDGTWRASGYFIR